MELEVLRISSEDDYTLGVLYELTPNYIDLKQKQKLCFTLEDEHRNVKEMGETRIPEGRYEIKLRTVGGFHNRYSQRFDWHEGMLEITGIDNFENVLIHIGNDDEDTAGCLLVGSGIGDTYSDGFVGNSTKTYEDVYKKILKRLKEERVYITYIDYDFM